MPNEIHGRLIEVKTKFHSEALKPGGVGRSGAHMAAVRSMTALKTQVEQQLEDCVAPLADTLRNWPTPDVARACAQAGKVRDLAGLADMHLLTEVAMHSFDCLDAVLIDGASMERAEAVCYADALIFAQQSRGSDLDAFQPLLKDLESLTTLIIQRNRARNA